jgi:hypothetical protein
VTYTVGFVVNEPRRLAALEARDKNGLKAWYEEARVLQEALAKPGPEVPHLHFIQHYLIDADIRLKDPRYREHQEAGLREALEALSRIAE